MHKNLTLLRALVIAGLVAPSLASATDGYFSNGYGMKSNGMGGAAVAVALEPFGGAVNPGAMAFLGNEWQAGLAWFSPDRYASRSGSGMAGMDGYVDSGSKNFFMPEFGMNWKYRPDVALGITVYGNGGMNTDYAGGQISNQSACTNFRGGSPVGPYNLLCGNDNLGVDLMQLMIAPYVAWEFAKGHSVGIAPTIAYQRFAAEGLQMFDNPMFSNAPGSVTNNGHSDAWGFGARVGYMGQLTDYLSVGIAYSTKMNMGNFDDYKGLFAEEGGFDIPSNFTVGFALRPTRQWLLALDYERIFYDDAASVSNQLANIYACLPPQMGGQGLRDNCLGGSNGAGFGWENINVWKFGVQYQLDDKWTFRAGYNRSENPVTPANVTFNIIAPGVVENQFTLGTTYAIDKQSAITGTFMYADENSVTGTSLFAGFLQNPAVTETIGMKQYLLGVAYSRSF
ncbi:MAG: outer membrane protein transport protein [Betaproteobacteria bacterium]|jgi:long-chain fatty acid transport protein|nr:outer membrane protein transport protein [Betaproteobacteria bacterium]MBK7591003.1 outer membrane protein transport protein [Betaproteobacteria bacterium]MBK7743235.1 outer membrane protein transport protein [Betaproteobacteria bacterium]MBK9675963.1 outer membrane protein transport protein [Betaproteobacteria bacterium]